MMHGVGCRTLLIGVLCLLVCGVVRASEMTDDKENVTQQKDSRIILIHTDVLYKVKHDPTAEILVGNVQLSHDGAILYCDSARFYRQDNSFDAYGRVKMEQGDTITLFGDTLYYKGDEFTAHAIGNVKLYHKESRLETEFLDYYRLENLGVYHDGGTLYDKDNVLTSEWGQYSPPKSEAYFREAVVLTNPKFEMQTDQLYYYTDTEIAKIVSPTEIFSTDSTYVYSEDGRYDTRNGWADLLNRSYIIKGLRRIEGDSLHYDKPAHLSEAFGDVVLTDAANNVMLLGNRCEYNDSTGYAMATDSAVVVDYSAPDTLYAHGDTLKMFTYNMGTDSVYRDLYMYHKVRMYRRDIQGVCDSLVSLSKDSCTYLYGQPIVWNENQQIFGEEMRVYNNDSTIERMHVINQAMTIERVDSVSYNQVSAKEMFSFFENGEISRSEAKGNVYVAYFIDESDGSRIGMNYTETSLLHLYMKDKKITKIWMPSSVGQIYPVDMIPQDRRYLRGFAWFDYIRPKNKDDIFEWQAKAEKDMLKKTVRSDVPLQKLDDIR